MPSYAPIETGVVNLGCVIVGQDPQLEIHNKKGYGINVNKKWSDLNLTKAHAPIYTAVYVDGALLEGSVNQIKSPAVSANYFWSELEPKQNGDERTTLEGYVVKEVTITNTDPTVKADGTVTDPRTVTPLEAGADIEITATRTPQATPEGETADKTVSMYYDDRTTDWGSNDPTDLKWSNAKPDENGLIAFIDVYNKQFSLKILKTDRSDSDETLKDAHFDLYKQIHSSISGDIKNSNPITDSEDEASYVYTLSVPNEQLNVLKALTVTKKVEGAFGSKAKEFNFTLGIDSAGVDDEFEWTKNSEAQTPLAYTGGTFTLRHDDVAVFQLPKGATITVTEETDDYTSTFKLNDDEALEDSKITFEFTDDAQLLVTNRRNGTVMTGIISTVGKAVALIFIPAAAIGAILYRKRRRRRQTE